MLGNKRRIFHFRVNVTQKSSPLVFAVGCHFLRLVIPGACVDALWMEELLKVRSPNHRNVSDTRERTSQGEACTVIMSMHDVHGQLRGTHDIDGVCS